MSSDRTQGKVVTLAAHLLTEQGYIMGAQFLGAPRRSGHYASRCLRIAA